MPHALVSLPSRSMLPPPPTALEARFELTVDVERNLLRYVMAGFFDRATVEKVKARRIEAMGQLRCLPNRHFTLLDISGCKIQSREMMEQFAAMLSDPRQRARAMAVVVGGSLARMQITRVVDRQQVAFFATVAEAEAWLFPATPAQPAPTASTTDANPSRARQASSSAAIRIGSPGPL